MILLYSVPAATLLIAMVVLLVMILLFVTVPSCVLWILVTAFGLIFWAGFCIVILVLFIAIPLVIFLLWWLFILLGSIFVWFPVLAVVINIF